MKIITKTNKNNGLPNPDFNKYLKLTNSFLGQCTSLLDPIKSSNLIIFMFSPIIFYIFP